MTVAWRHINTIFLSMTVTQRHINKIDPEHQGLRSVEVFDKALDKYIIF